MQGPLNGQVLVRRDNWNRGDLLDPFRESRPLHQLGFQIMFNIHLFVSFPFFDTVQL